MRRVGQLVAQTRREKPGRAVSVDAALSEQPAGNFRQCQALSEGLPFCIVAGSQPPATAADRPLYP